MRIHICKQLIALLLALPFYLNISAQAWERDISGYTDPNLVFWVTELPNEDLVFSDHVSLTSVDRFGNFNWKHRLDSISTNGFAPNHLETSSGGNILTISLGPDSIHYLITISPQGVTLSEDTINYSFDFIHSFISLPNGECMVGEMISQNTPSLVKLSASGDTLWTRTFPPPPMGNRTMNKLIPTLDGGLMMAGWIDTGIQPLQATCTKIDGAGNVEWERSYFNNSNFSSFVRSIAQAPDSSFMMSVSHGPTASYNHLKISRTGDSLALYPFVGIWGKSDMITTTDGHLLTYGRFYGAVPPTTLIMIKQDWNGNVLWTINHHRPFRRNIVAEVIPLADSGFAAVGESINSFTNTAIGAYVARTHPNGTPFNNLIHGYAYYDLNNNCNKDTNEPVVPNTIFHLTGDTNTYFSSDINGDLFQAMDAGNYQLMIANAGNYWAASTCAPPITINFPGTGDSTFIEFPIVPSILCTDMQVDISALALPVCSDADYFVTYKNVGTASATNSYIDVTLPPSVTFDSATAPWTLQTNGDYRFALGTVPSLADSGFRIDVSVDCPPNPLVLMGQTECAIAKIYPDTVCLTGSAVWDSSNVEVELQCLSSDSLRFKVENNSNSSMTTQGNYLVLEDNILRVNNIFQLTALDSIVFFRPGNGSTWTLIADQSVGHPTSTQPLISIEGCGLDSSGNFMTGVITQMPQDDGSSSISIFCGTYVGSYDPNDKLAFPEGLGDMHEIEKHEEIEYMIRFQNTGTYFAQDVILIDTLDPGLDPSTLRLVGGSHPYHWQLEAGNILKVEFLNIMLPDSGRDEPNSHGFVKYEITPDSSVVPGQQIFNRAAIYFDYNPPIITNTVFHTIALNMFGLVSLDEISEDTPLGLNVYPNPFREETTFRLEEPLGKDARFTMVDINGQTVYHQRPGAVREFKVRPAELAEGLYFFQLSDGKGKRATGKVLLRK